jgi:hypothetical protein
MRYRLELVVDDQLGHELSESEPIKQRQWVRLSGSFSSDVLKFPGRGLHVDGLGQGGDNERIPPLVFTAAKEKKKGIRLSLDSQAISARSEPNLLSLHYKSTERKTSRSALPVNN